MTNQTNLPILIVDDEKSFLFSLSLFLNTNGFKNVITCYEPLKVMDILSENNIEIIILDLIMPSLRGEDLIPNIVREYPEIPVIIISAYDDCENAAKCIKLGGFDFIKKPIDEERLLSIIKHAISFRQLKRENRVLKLTDKKENVLNPKIFSKIITQDDEMFRLFRYSETIAQTSQPILITGETGVGKDLFANAIHELSGLEGSFISVNIAGLDDPHFSDTLFGHSKGAFTGANQDRPGLIEEAKNGTLFLDEIGDLSIPSQTKLLRLIQEGEYLPLGKDQNSYSNARIVTATNINFHDIQSNYKFRKDLFYRLEACHLHIPPLRERLKDIPLLTKKFILEASKEFKKNKLHIPPQLFTILNNYNYPGNIRELRSMIFKAVSLHKKGGTLSSNIFSHIISEKQKLLGIENVPPGSNESLIHFSSYRLPTLKEAADLLIKEALNRSDGNETQAAQFLGISQQALNKRLKKDAD